jgi:hypothetical protein
MAQSERQGVAGMRTGGTGRLFNPASTRFLVVVRVYILPDGHANIPSGELGSALIPTPEFLLLLSVREHPNPFLFGSGAINWEAGWTQSHESCPDKREESETDAEGGNSNCSLIPSQTKQTDMCLVAQFPKLRDPRF